MENFDFENVRDKSLVNEIMDLIKFAEEYHVDISNIIEYVRRVLIIAEKKKNSDIVDELLSKIKHELDEIIAIFVIKQSYDLEYIIYNEHISNKQVETYKKLALSAIGIKHYRLALQNLAQCKAEIEKLNRPKFEKLQATDMIKCDICQGNIKPGMSYYKCACGKAYHDTCAARTGRCSCSVEFE